MIYSLGLLNIVVVVADITMIFVLIKKTRTQLKELGFKRKFLDPDILKTAFALGLAALTVLIAYFSGLSLRLGEFNEVDHSVLIKRDEMTLCMMIATVYLLAVPQLIIISSYVRKVVYSDLTKVEESVMTEDNEHDEDFETAVKVEENFDHW